MDKHELTRAMKALGMNARQLGEELGLSERAVYYRMSGELPVRASEAKAINMMMAAKQAADETTRTKD